MARVEKGTYPTDLEIDEQGYPSDAKVEEITMISWKDTRRWLHDEFPRLWDQIPYGSVRTEETKDIADEPALEIYVATGGWSGCESVIYAVIGHFALRRFLEQRLSGGGYTFVVPHTDSWGSAQ